MNEECRKQWSQELRMLTTVQLAALVILEPDLTDSELEVIHEIAAERLARGDCEADEVIL